MPEQDLEIKANGDFKNIYLKTRYNRDSKGDLVLKDGKKVVLEQGLEDGNFVIVEKVFPTGMKIEKPTYTFYSCKVKYKDDEVTFILYENEHEQYLSCGGQGDKVKISLTKETVINKKTGAESLRDCLHFEKIEE